MTREELDKFEARLDEQGYKKYPAMNNADYAWFKSFGKSKHKEGRCNYQIAFSIYDFSPYAYRDDNLRKSPYRVSASILLSRCIDERVDVEIGSVNDVKYKNIDYIESLAESFYQWAEKEIEL